MDNKIWHLSKNETPSMEDNRIIIAYTENKKHSFIGKRIDLNLHGYYRWAYLDEVDPNAIWP